ncbi:hypothetical protein BB8028_0010g00560 [Beauveria bassiana]|uniref:Zn(2)-C6 fungal-type domain-containing protein n=1 Tax=Beauveria bassiana TaxID=176275 RepID=A0A2S7YPT0_BEABA|nr:hypothetical protein BB8028_0010g00560 [Beauveria bassiana]
MHASHRLVQHSSFLLSTAASLPVAIVFVRLLHRELFMTLLTIPVLSPFEQSLFNTMAGRGGDPPRRSHTKSRKGCETCKRRRIRCDESFPQCRNCTKHKVRCPYNDMQVTPEPERSATPDKPDLMWTTEQRLPPDKLNHL